MGSWKASESCSYVVVMCSVLCVLQDRAGFPPAPFRIKASVRLTQGLSDVTSPGERSSVSTFPRKQTASRGASPPDEREALDRKVDSA
jgi:hypothetical protein